ncbi:MAG: hypothetical protein LKI80_08260 [Sporolactobacillus sp.]|nr:hypothetical protein [Sporolactobacillus sp.]
MEPKKLEPFVGAARREAERREIRLNRKLLLTHLILAASITLNIKLLLG